MGSGRAEGARGLLPPPLLPLGPAEARAPCDRAQRLHAACLPPWETMAASLRVEVRGPPQGLVAGRGLRLLVPDGDRPFPVAWGAQFTVSSGDDEGRFHVLIDPEAPEEAVNVPKEQPQDGSPGWVTAAHTRGQSARGARERAAASRLPPPKSHRR